MTVAGVLRMYSTLSWSLVCRFIKRVREAAAADEQVAHLQDR